MKLHSSTFSGFLVALAAFTGHVAANADKIIFTGPEPVTYPLAAPSLADLNLDVLGPENLAIRTNLSRLFHDDENVELRGKPRGHVSWFILDDLTPGQRYELRVCWAAIEPTEFSMDVYELDTVWESPDLMSSLANYTSTRTASSHPAPFHSRRDGQERQASLLLLQVHAAADYFSHDAALMRNPPPPVLVDLILDPYLFNAVPESLVLTAGYVVLVAVAMFYLARWIANRMVAIAATQELRATAKKMD